MALGHGPEDPLTAREIRDSLVFGDRGIGHRPHATVRFLPVWDTGIAMVAWRSRFAGGSCGAGEIRDWILSKQVLVPVTGR